MLDSPLLEESPTKKHIGTEYLVNMQMPLIQWERFPHSHDAVTRR
jgi:hypothetical protein